MGRRTPGVAFDCSGLVQAAYAAAGITLPRVAQDQYNAGRPVPAGEPLQPGDLVFFGTSPTDITHVGIVLGNGEMIDAPTPAPSSESSLQLDRLHRSHPPRKLTSHPSWI